MRIFSCLPSSAQSCRWLVTAVRSLLQQLSLLELPQACSRRNNRRNNRRRYQHTHRRTNPRTNRRTQMPEHATIDKQMVTSHTSHIKGVHIMSTWHEVWSKTALLMCSRCFNPVGSDSGVDTASKLHSAASKVRDRIINKICMLFEAVMIEIDFHVPRPPLSPALP